jgi:hypothetical protein
MNSIESNRAGQRAYTRRKREKGICLWPGCWINIGSGIHPVFCEPHILSNRAKGLKHIQKKKERENGN